jgi:hypothetical protein
MAFLVPYSLITRGIYNVFIASIGTVTLGTYKVISSIYNNQNADVGQFIKKLDIERKLALIESVLKYKKISREQSGQSEQSYESEQSEQSEQAEQAENVEMTELAKSSNVIHPIQLCFSDLSDIITKIQSDLKEIDRKVRKHNLKWFKSYRSLHISKELEQLETNVGILDARFDDLIKISGICRT